MDLFMEGAVGLGIALIEQRPELLAALRLAKRVVGEAGRVENIVVGGDHVVIAP